MITTIVTTITMTIMITITAITTIMITAITIIMTTIIMTMITIAAVDTITIITTIIMQMMCLQAGAKRLFINTEEELDYLLKALSETTSYGTILRSKGIIQMTDGSWKQFDLVPEEYEVREGQPDYTGRICVIGTDLKEDDLLKLFHV